MDQKDEVKAKVDIVEVISSHMPLKKAGRNYSGLCPFHGEKTPSFMVSPERQVFKCFGCGESGDVFTFLEKTEGWDFREALEEMAKKVGVKLKKTAPSGTSARKEKLLEINNLTTKFYSYILEKHALGVKAREYLKKRGINDSTVKKFGLGFAPGGWENTYKFLLKKGFSGADISEAGLVVASQKRAGQKYFDRFRNRLMFPIKDGRGTLLGFSGRLLEGNDREAKYINSPETPIFTKGNLLFGLDIARKAIRDKNEAILVEGEFDVLSAFQVGVENVIASKGTALTEKQVVTISRLCETVSLCFDTDLAGDKASRRGIELLDVAGLQVKVVGLGKYADPDEFAQKDSKGFKKNLKESQNIFDYFIDSALKRYDGKSSEGKKKIGREIIPVLSSITDDLVRAHYIDKFAKVLDLDVNLIAGAVEKKKVSVFSSDEIILSRAGSKQDLNLEKYFLALFMFQDDISTQALKFVKPEDFEDKKSAELWKALNAIIGTSKKPTVAIALKKLPNDLSEYLDELFLLNLSPVFADREIWAGEVAKIASRIRKAAIKRKLAQISSYIKEAEKTKNMKKIEKLSKSFDTLSKDLKEENVNAY